MADSNSSGISLIVRATLSPRPPPPNAALMAIGRPCSVAKAMTSSASATGSAVPGTSGAPTFWAMCRAWTLSPRASMAAGRRTDPDQPGVDHGLRRRRRSRPGSRTPDGSRRRRSGGDVEDLGDVEVGLGRRRAAQRVRLVGERDEQRVGVRVGVDGDAWQPGVGRGPDHADGDLATVGDEHLADSHGSSHRKRPHRPTLMPHRRVRFPCGGVVPFRPVRPAI